MLVAVFDTLSRKITAPFDVVLACGRRPAARVPDEMLEAFDANDVAFEYAVAAVVSAYEVALVYAVVTSLFVASVCAPPTSFCNTDCPTAL